MTKLDRTMTRNHAATATRDLVDLLHFDLSSLLSHSTQHFKSLVYVSGSTEHLEPRDYYQRAP